MSTNDGANSHRGSDGEFMLFGVRVRVDPMRKSVSLNDLSQYHHNSSSAPAAVDVPSAAAGYASADDAVPLHNPRGTSRERKRGVPWTEEEHKLFLLGLQKVGKGDWRGISRNFVKTRTPTQVASHAQKYFLRRSNLNRRRRRSSLFDITTESVVPIPMEEIVHKEHKSRPIIPPAQLPLPESSIFRGPQDLHFPLSMCPTSVPLQINTTPVENFNFGHVGHINQHDLVPTQMKMVDFNLNQSFSEDSSSPLSLNLSLSLDRVQDQFSRVSAFEVMSSFSNGDSSMISVT